MFSELCVFIVYYVVNYSDACEVLPINIIPILYMGSPNCGFLVLVEFQHFCVIIIINKLKTVCVAIKKGLDL